MGRFLELNAVQLEVVSVEADYFPSQSITIGGLNVPKTLKSEV